MAQLARTVVVEDIDSAIAIGKKYKNRFKIVTLDGQVINAGGSMTGGSKIQNAGILSRTGAIDEQKKELEELRKKLAFFEDSFKLTTEDLAKAKADMVAASADLTTANEEKVRLESALSLVRGQLKSVEEALSELEDENKNSRVRVEEFEKIIDACEKEEKKLEGELKRSNSMLSNERFISKAPAEKIAEEKAKLEKYEATMKQVQERLAALKK